VRVAARAAGRTVAVLADLQGPKIRLGEFAQGKATLETGAEFTISTESVIGDAHAASTTYEGLAHDVRPGDAVLIADGLVRLAAERVAGPRVTCRVIEGGPEHGDHLIWRTPAPGAPILLVGHHDTVFPPGHFEGWREADGKATGPGALDMKGGLSVIRGALAALEEVGVLAQLPIAVISVGDEETGSPSSTPHLKDLATGAACALVFESGRAGDAIITRRKGVGAMTVTARGKAAHAGNHVHDRYFAPRTLVHPFDPAKDDTVSVRDYLVSAGADRCEVEAEISMAMVMGEKTKLVFSFRESTINFRAAGKAWARDAGSVEELIRCRRPQSDILFHRKPVRKCRFPQWATIAEVS